MKDILYLVLSANRRRQINVFSLFQTANPQLCQHMAYTPQVPIAAWLTRLKLYAQTIWSQ